MPTLKRNVKDAPDRAGFEPYEGPTPRRGTYRGVIKSMKLKKAASSGRDGFGLVVEFQALEGSDHAKYDGYAAYPDVWLGDNESLQAREKQLYRAITGKAEPGEVNVVTDDSGKVTKVGGVNPVGKFILVVMKDEIYDNESRIKADDIFAPKTQGPAAKSSTPEPEEDDDQEALEDAEDDGEEIDPEERETELKALTLPALRKVAGELEIETKGLTKVALVEAILDAEFGEVEDEEAEESDEEEEADDEAEDLEDAEEEDDSAEEELRAELAEFDRTALKKRLKEVQPEFTVLKRHTDEELLEAIVLNTLGDEPPF